MPIPLSYPAIKYVVNICHNEIPICLVKRYLWYPKNKCNVSGPDDDGWANADWWRGSDMVPNSLLLMWTCENSGNCPSKCVLDQLLHQKIGKKSDLGKTFGGLEIHWSPFISFSFMRVFFLQFFKPMGF